MNSLAKAIQESYKTLKEKERKVLILYFGLAGKIHTLHSTGQKFGITRERVRQIRNAALKKVSQNPQKLLKRYIQKIQKAIKDAGGLSSQKTIIAKFVKDQDEVSQNRLIFTLNLMPDIKKIKETKEHRTFWAQKAILIPQIRTCQKQIRQILEKTQKPQKPE